jgi:hypothetical protein
MNLKSAIGLICLFSIPSVPGGVEASTDTLKVSWIAYNHAVLRFEYPKGWEVSRHLFPSRETQLWVIEPPSQVKGFPPGAIRIREDLLRKERRKLNRLFTIAKASQVGIVDQEEAEPVRLRGGNCLLYETRGTGYAPGSIPLTADADCYSKNGHYFQLRCDLLGYGEAKAEAEPRRKIFRHLLDTLEFK